MCFFLIAVGILNWPPSSEWKTSGLRSSTKKQARCLRVVGIGAGAPNFCCRPLRFRSVVPLVTNHQLIMRSISQKKKRLQYLVVEVRKGVARTAPGPCFEKSGHCRYLA